MELKCGTARQTLSRNRDDGLRFPTPGTSLFVIPVILFIAISRYHEGFSLALARCLLPRSVRRAAVMVGFA